MIRSGTQSQRKARAGAPYGVAPPRRCLLEPVPSPAEATAAIEGRAAAVGATLVRHGRDWRLDGMTYGDARGRVGRVIDCHGGWVLPDSNAHGRGENPEHLYTVCFSGEELWGPSAEPATSVNIDLFESYLEAV